MFAFLMNLISTNPWYGPVWFGAIADLFLIGITIYLIASHRRERHGR